MRNRYRYTSNDTLSYTNPRLRAEIADWPMGGFGSKRGTALFTIEAHEGKGERGVRTTSFNGVTYKPRALTFARKVRIVDGSDGKVYIAELATHGDLVAIMRGDMHYEEEVINASDPRYSAVLALFD